MSVICDMEGNANESNLPGPLADSGCDMMVNTSASIIEVAADNASKSIELYSEGSTGCKSLLNSETSDNTEAVIPVEELEALADAFECPDFGIQEDGSEEMESEPDQNTLELYVKKAIRTLKLEKESPRIKNLVVREIGRKIEANNKLIKELEEQLEFLNNCYQNMLANPPVYEAIKFEEYQFEDHVSGPVIFEEDDEEVSEVGK